jgi:superfamily I DNA/RNA helicase
MRLPDIRLDEVGLESEGEVRAIARLVTQLDSIIKHLIAKPLVLDLGHFLDALRNVRCIALIIGNPGTGKTEYATRLIRGDVKICGVGLPTPGLVLAFTNADAAELRHRVGDLDGFEVATLHSIAVRTVDINSMVGYAIEVPGTKRVVKVRRGDREYEREFVDIALAQEKLRFTVARSVGLPYSMDPFVESLGNKVFHTFDIYVHTQGLSEPGILLDKLLEIDARLAHTIKLYLGCLSGKVGRVEDIQCSNAYDFSTVLLELLHSSVPALGSVPIRSLVIDEWQDWSPLMNAVLANWVRHVDFLVVAGDPDQLVYHSLNGAREDAFLSIYRAIKEGRVKGEIIHLSRSHRVLEPLNRLAVGVLRRYTKPQDWDNWGGRKSEGSIPMVHIKAWGQVLRELVDLYNNNKLKRYFILAPVNAGVLYATRSLLAHGIVPLFLKSVPSMINYYVGIAKKVIRRYLADKPTILGVSNDDIIRYVPASLELEEYRIVRSIINFAIETANRERGSDESGLEALARVLNDYLNPRQMTYNHNPDAHVYVDTIYTAKGLEAEHVILLNWDIKRREIDAYLARLWYVGLTRSRGSITFVPPPEDSKFVDAIPLSVIIAEAQGAGIEVINHAGQA